ncbi:S8 family serine peptidase [Methanohalophilus mahii]|uniref:Peptidase S8 and S53 subtilisin kexin sedolisin n=1 Tax=Methanohalophilus mahii (strain ATCC 35705 / DSM 5219 / SLP) TaxID=547558 RepID=D5EBI2_METMS|nr:S8 family serine peptidase [Methanohalophilus mahii]ADE36533.1 peptidase S8 and S53 subtilisin kexin sedolisin [Methanohalophilus mahii DSM 5219]
MQNQSDWILLKHSHINTDEAGSSIQTQSVVPFEKGYYIVQFTGIIQPEWQEEIQNISGIYGYIPENAYVLYLNDTKANHIKALPYFKWMGKIKPEYKIEPEIRKTKGNITLNIKLYKNDRALNTTDYIEKMGGIVLSGNSRLLQVHINSSLIDSIAALENVEWIEKHHKPVILNNNASRIMNVTTIHQNYSLTGSGQIIGIADTGVDTGYNNESMHDDIEGRIINISSWGDEDASDTHGHGTHVAGSALGNGSLSGGKYSGTAPAANLVFQAIGDEDGDLPGVSTSEDLFELLSFAYAKNARIHSNSWGNSNNSYTTYSEVADEFIWNHTDMLVLFAAGNYGENGSYTVGSPATAKNILTIGATENLRPEKDSLGDNPDEIASFSSRGPTADGRIKPDLVAPGTWIISIRSSKTTNESIFWEPLNDSYAYMGGTSMATPLAAGTSALVRQYYMENLSISPSAALIKATLINGADDLGYNRTTQGWGRINLTASLYPPAPAEVAYYDNISLTTGETWQTKQYVKSNQTPFKATLVWTDHPGSTKAEKVLVNDLDFTIMVPNGSILYGNGGEGPDRLNNIEQVLLASPDTGNYTLCVNGSNIPEGPQPFAFVVSADIDVTPPASITDLHASNIGCTWINWTWSNPDDTDFNHTMVYLDGELKGNVSNEYYNATDLYPNTTYEIAIRTVDVNGNINTTWQNDSATTDEDTLLPVVYSASLDNYTPGMDETITLNVNATDAESGIGNITAFMDGTSPSIPLDYNTTSGNYTATFYAEYGWHSMNISVTDNASNTRWDNSTSYEGKDVTSPVITSVILDNHIPEVGEYIALKVNASDNIDIMDVTAYNGSMSTTVELTLNDGNYTGNLLANPGLNAVNVSATDTSGNTGWYNDTFYIAGDDEKPVISNVSIDSPTPFIGDPVILEVNTSDNIGILNVTAYNGSMSSPIELILDTDGNYTGTLIANSGINTVNISATDASGNTAWDNSTIYDGQDKPGDSNNEKGSSGGGGGSATGEEYSNIKFKDFSIRSVKAEVPTIYNFEEKENPVIDIDLISSKNSGQAKLIIEVLKNTSTLTNEPPIDTVYINLNIWAGSSGFENHIRNSSVTFKVEKEWITQENIDIENIRLEVFEDGQWISLPTEYIDEVGNYLHFKTATDKYLNSPFVIAGSEMEQKSNAENDNVIAETNNLNTQKTDTNESVNNVSGEAEKNVLGSEKVMDKMLPAWILIIAFIVRRKLE